MTSQEFLDILLNDTGFDTRLKRNAFLTGEVGREVKYLDDFDPQSAPHGLTQRERSRIIDELRERRDRGKAQPEEDEE